MVRALPSANAESGATREGRGVGRSVVGAVAGVVLAVALSIPAGAHAESSNLGAYIRPVGGVKVGDKVPNFHAKAINGEDLDLATLLRYQKKVCLVFWSMYCQACLEKMEAMVQVQKKFEYSGLKVISVNTDGEYRKGEQVIRDFIAEFEKQQGVTVNFPILYDESNWLALALSVDFLPTLMTLDQEGRILEIYRRFGETSLEQTLAGIEDLVQKQLALKGGPPAAPAPGKSPAPAP